MHYTLVGFSTELDWRRLDFLKPLPQNMVCSTCGLVRPNTALLPCAHTLCETCYQQRAEGGPHICPLDGYQCQEEDLDWRELRVEELLRRKVKCWNEGNGCDFVAAVSRIALHFQGNCRCHYVLCPKCSGAVLWRNVVQHVKGCFYNSAAPPRAYGEGQPGDRKARAFDSSVKGTFRKQVAEANEGHKHVVSASKTHDDELDVISQAIKSVKETVERNVVVEVGQDPASLRRIMSKMEASDEKRVVLVKSSDTPIQFSSVLKLQRMPKDEKEDVDSPTRFRLTRTATVSPTAKAEAQEKNDSPQNTLDCIKGILRQPELDKALCVFVVKRVNSLQETALKTGAARYESELVYLRGYNLSPGVLMKRRGESVNMHVLMRVYKGNMDDQVQWPLEPNIKIGVVHPNDGADRVFEVNGNPYQPSFQRPTACSNSSAYFALQSLNLECLIRDDYVENDQLRVMFELLR
ncbi:TNF receptor-associated factor 6-like [Amblyomma americanum]